MTGIKSCLYVDFFFFEEEWNITLMFENLNSK